MAKLKATETAKRVALECMQMMSGYGYATEYGIECHLRSAVVSTVYGGTSEIQRDIIGRSYGLQKSLTAVRRRPPRRFGRGDRRWAG